MSKRRTFAQVIAETEKRVRRDTIDELCRILKHHLDCPEIAEELSKEMTMDRPKKQHAGLSSWEWPSG